MKTTKNQNNVLVKSPSFFCFESIKSQNPNFLKIFENSIISLYILKSLKKGPKYIYQAQINYCIKQKTQPKKPIFFYFKNDVPFLNTVQSLELKQTILKFSKNNKRVFSEIDFMFFHVRQSKDFVFRHNLNVVLYQATFNQLLTKTLKSFLIVGSNLKKKQNKFFKNKKKILNLNSFFFCKKKNLNKKEKINKQNETHSLLLGKKKFLSKFVKHSVFDKPLDFSKAIYKFPLKTNSKTNFIKLLSELQLKLVRGFALITQSFFGIRNVIYIKEFTKRNTKYLRKVILISLLCLLHDKQGSTFFLNRDVKQTPYHTNQNIFINYQNLIYLNMKFLGNFLFLYKTLTFRQDSFINKHFFRPKAAQLCLRSIPVNIKLCHNLLSLSFYNFYSFDCCNKIRTCSNKNINILVILTNLEMTMKLLTNFMISCVSIKRFPSIKIEKNALRSKSGLNFSYSETILKINNWFLSFDSYFKLIHKRKTKNSVKYQLDTPIKQDICTKTKKNKIKNLLYLRSLHKYNKKKKNLFFLEKLKKKATDCRFHKSNNFQILDTYFKKIFERYIKFVQIVTQAELQLYLRSSHGVIRFCHYNPLMQSNTDKNMNAKTKNKRDFNSFYYNNFFIKKISIFWYNFQKILFKKYLKTKSLAVFCYISKYLSFRQEKLTKNKLEILKIENETETISMTKFLSLFFQKFKAGYPKPFCNRMLLCSVNKATARFTRSSPNLIKSLSNKRYLETQFESCSYKDLFYPFFRSKNLSFYFQCFRLSIMCFLNTYLIIKNKFLSELHVNLAVALFTLQSNILLQKGFGYPALKYNFLNVTSLKRYQLLLRIFKFEQSLYYINMGSFLITRLFQKYQKKTKKKTFKSFKLRFESKTVTVTNIFTSKTFGLIIISLKHKTKPIMDILNVPKIPLKILKNRSFYQNTRSSTLRNRFFLLNIKKKKIQRKKKLFDISLSWFNFSKKIKINNNKTDVFFQKIKKPKKNISKVFTSEIFMNYAHMFKSLLKSNFQTIRSPRLFPHLLKLTSRQSDNCKSNRYKTELSELQVNVAVSNILLQKGFALDNYNFLIFDSNFEKTLFITKKMNNLNFSIFYFKRCFSILKSKEFFNSTFLKSNLDQAKKIFHLSFYNKLFFSKTIYYKNTKNFNFCIKAIAKKQYFHFGKKFLTNVVRSSFYFLHSSSFKNLISHEYLTKKQKPNLTTTKSLSNLILTESDLLLRTKTLSLSNSLFSNNFFFINFYFFKILLYPKKNIPSLVVFNFFINHSFFKRRKKNPGLYLCGFYLYHRIKRTFSRVFFSEPKSFSVYKNFINSMHRIYLHSVQDQMPSSKQKVYNYITFILKINPTASKIRFHLDCIRQTIHQCRSASQEFLIKKLSPIIRSWSLYYKNINHKFYMNYCDFITFKMLWRWACRRHPKKNKKWIKKKYFKNINGKNWIFSVQYKQSSVKNHELGLITRLNFDQLKKPKNFVSDSKKKSTFLFVQSSHKFIFICLPIHSDINIKKVI